MAYLNATRSIRTARELLTGRLFTVTNQYAYPAAAAGLATSGIIVTGTSALTRISHLRNTHPDAILVAEPLSLNTDTATVEIPFIFGDNEALFADTLDDVLQRQLDVGADIAILPTGYVPVGENETLRAIVAAANLVVRRDTALMVSLDANWLRPDNIKFLIAVMKSATIPVLVGFADPQSPLGTQWALRGYRKLFNAVPGLFAHRTDMAGFDAYAHGATGASIGSIPSLRRFTPPEKKPWSSNPVDPTPHVLVESMLRYVRGSVLATSYYQATPAPGCPCIICGGRPIDRFITGDDDDKREAALHSAFVLAKLWDRVDVDNPRAWWRSVREDTTAANTALAAVIGRPVKDPYLSFWETLDSES
jgi:hypothetical protein